MATKTMNSGEFADEYFQKLAEYMTTTNEDGTKNVGWVKLCKLNLAICRRPRTTDFLLGPLQMMSGTRRHARKSIGHDDVPFCTSRNGKKMFLFTLDGIT